MTAESPTIRLERYSERHVEGLTALYNDPAVARQGPTSRWSSAASACTTARTTTAC